MTPNDKILGIDLMKDYFKSLLEKEGSRDARALEGVEIRSVGEAKNIAEIVRHMQLCQEPSTELIQAKNTLLDQIKKLEDEDTAAND